MLIAIICGIVFFTNKNGILRTPMLLGSIGRNRIGEGAELGSDAFPSGSGETVGQTVDLSKWDMNRVNAVADTEGVYVPVPKGFVASGATGEHTVNTGFVIYEGEEPVDDENAWDESCTRNQFVWVPVPDPSRVFEEIGTTGKKKAKLWEYNYVTLERTEVLNGDTDNRKEPGILKNQYNISYDIKQNFSKYGMQGYTEEILYKELATSFESNMESIKKYGGFYVGRFETGNITQEQPVVQRMNITLYGNGQTWYSMYPKMRNISANKNIQTSLIWGCVFDETLQWLIDSGCKTKEEIANDSTSWGNFSTVTFEYINENGEIATKEVKYQGPVIPTGSTERNISNNIYDLAGNVVEMTLERMDSGSTGNRCHRGGYANGMSAKYVSRREYTQPYGIGFQQGYRSYCIIK